jgi:hypothetical protein
MEYLIVGSLAGLLLWTAAVAGVTWYVGRKVAAANLKAELLELAIDGKEIEIDQLTEIMESMEKGEQMGVAHLRRRIEAGRAADPRSRRRLLYAGVSDGGGGGAETPDPAPVDEAGGSDTEVAEA